MGVLLWGCRDRLGRRQVAGCCCGVAEACQDAGKDPFVIVGLQRGAATPFIPARLRKGLLLQDYWSGAAWVPHAPGARDPYLHAGTVPGQRGKRWVRTWAPAVPAPSASPGVSSVS